MTSNDFTDPHFKNNLCATVEDLLSMNVVPVFNENDAISKGAVQTKVCKPAAILFRLPSQSTMVKHARILARSVSALL